MTNLSLYKISDYALSDLYQKLPLCFRGSEEQKIKKYKKENDQKRSLIGKIAVNYHLLKMLKIGEEGLIFTRDGHDRIFLTKPFYKHLDFNISHSGQFVLVGINTNGKIGVDVEKIIPIDLEISKNVFVDKEIKYINRDKKNILNNFYKLWTLKESFVKAVGEGLSYPLKKFHFEFQNDEIMHLINNRKSDWKFKTYSINPKYKTAVCLDGNDFPKTINQTKLFL